MNQLLVVCSLSMAALAGETRYWSQDTQADFEKGTFKKVALRSDGRLSLSPAVNEIADLSLPYLWTAAAGANGAVYVAGGPASGKSAIYEITRTGQRRTVAEVEGMNVFALAVDKAGQIYAGSSPDGKIYKISTAGKVETFYDPKAKYIWALQFLPGGDLLAATGDKGEVHRITASGVGKVWMDLDEDHVRSLAINAKGTVYAGTEPNGLVVKADADGKPFVLYQSSKREVTSLAVLKDGGVYAGIIGLKSGGTSIMIPVLPMTPPPAAPGQNPVQMNPAQRAQAAPIVPIAVNVVPGGSEVVRIDADGAPSRVWTHPSDLVYSLAVDAGDRLLLGTGNKGGLYRIDSPSQSTLLRGMTSTQITALVKDGARLLAVTGNVGKVFEIAEANDAEGVYESDVFDVGNFSQWGRVHSKEVLNGGTIRYETRSGNLDRPTQMWSPWAALKDGRIVSPSARFLQWRAVFAGGRQDGPELSQVDVAYLPKNLAPRIDLVEPTPANYRFPAPSVLLTPASMTLSLPPIGRSVPAVQPALPDASSSPSLSFARGMIGARWMASDDNNDTLEYAIEIKGEAEQQWKPLKDKLRDRYYSFDSTAFSDGKYRTRVTASDAPSNPLGQGLTATGLSAPFTIDNTAPAIRGLAASPAGGRVSLRFQAVDSASVVSKAEVSLNGGLWAIVEPTVRLADSKELDYQLSLDRPAAGELTIAVRVTDEFENQSVEKITIR